MTTTEANTDTTPAPATPAPNRTISGEALIGKLRAQLDTIKNDAAFGDVCDELDRQHAVRCAEAREQEKEEPKLPWTLRELVETDTDDLIRSVNAIEKAVGLFEGTRDNLVVTQLWTAVQEHVFADALFGRLRANFFAETGEPLPLPDLRDRKVRYQVKGNAEFALGELQKVADQVMALCAVADWVRTELIGASPTMQELAGQTFGDIPRWVTDEDLAEIGFSSRQLSAATVCELADSAAGRLVDARVRKAAAHALKGMIKRTCELGNDREAMEKVRRLNDEVLFAGQDKEGANQRSPRPGTQAHPRDRLTPAPERTPEQMAEAAKRRAQHEAKKRERAAENRARASRNQPGGNKGNK